MKNKTKQVSVFNVKHTTLCFILFLLFGFLRTEAQNTNSVNQPVTNANYYKSSEEAEAADDRIYAQLDSLQILETVQKKTGASKADMDLFVLYYADKLTTDRDDYISNSKFTPDNNVGTQLLKHYASEKTDEYVKMYRKLEEMKKEFPSTIAEYTAPHRPVILSSPCDSACTNIGFESGNLSGWYAYDAANNSSTTTFSYTAATGGACGAVTKAALDVATNNWKKDTTYQITITSGKGLDPIAGSLIPVVAPGGGNYSCRLGDSSVGGSRVGILEQTFIVTPRNENFTYQYAILIDQANHSYGQQPYFTVTITDQTTGNTLPCGVYTVVSGPGIPGFHPILYTIPSTGYIDTIYCKPWTTVFVPLQNYLGHCISVQATVSDCWPTKPGPHFCYAYFDASCQPLTTLASASNLCGGNATITAPAGGTYQWTGPCIATGTDTSQTVTVNCAGTYTVNITSPDGCSDTLQKVITSSPAMTLTATSVNGGCGSGGSATVTVNGGVSPYTYSWSDGTTNAYDTGLGAGTYTCTVIQPGGCSNSATVTISGSTVKAQISGNASLCSGNSTTLTASGGTTYTWSNGATTSSITVTPSSTGNYSVTVSNGSCKDSARVTVQVNTAPTVTISPDTAICTGNSITLNVTGGGTYSWNTSSTSGTITVSPSSTTTYSVAVTQNGCTKDTTITISVSPPPVVSISPSENICAGEYVILTATGGGEYKWNTGSTNDTIKVNPALSATYSVIVFNGCAVQASTSVNVEIPAFNACCDTIMSPGDSTRINAGGTDIVHYTWVPNTALNCDTCPTVTATPTVTTTYTVTGKDSAGCTVERIVTVTIEVPCTKGILVPDVFTPNGDGINDLFQITLASNPGKIDGYSIIIYDRWGKEMYKSTNLNQPWNGDTEGGNKAIDGVYFYIIQATCQGNTYDKHGFVQLIR